MRSSDIRPRWLLLPTYPHQFSLSLVDCNLPQVEFIPADFVKILAGVILGGLIFTQGKLPQMISFNLF